MSYEDACSEWWGEDNYKLITEAAERLKLTRVNSDIFRKEKIDELIGALERAAKCEKLGTDEIRTLTLFPKITFSPVFDEGMSKAAELVIQRHEEFDTFTYPQEYDINNMRVKYPDINF